MTKMVDGVLFIERGAEGPCELCGKVEELRPYGPNGEKICYDCGMKDEETTKKQFLKIMKGEKL